MKKFKVARGFTLIEILVVIGIIAILAAIVIIAINPARQFAQARNSQRTANVNAILNAVGQYVADNKGILPTEISGLAADTETDISTAGADICANLVPTYMPALTTDPETDPDVGAGTSFTVGEAISSAKCTTAHKTGYTVTRDALNRVTICAPESASEPSLPSTPEICVTR